MGEGGESVGGEAELSGVSGRRGEEHRLDDAYRATTYRVFIEGEEAIDLRIGDCTEALDDLLSHHGCDRWAFITACNPHSQPLPTEENAARQAELVAFVRERGWALFDGMGMPADSSWQPEASVLVLGISREDAVGIAKRFRQNAIVVGERGGAAELVYCV